MEVESDDFSVYPIPYLKIYKLKMGADFFTIFKVEIKNHLKAIITMPKYTTVHHAL